MKKLIVGFVLLGCLFSMLQPKARAVEDLRKYVDGSAIFTSADSLEPAYTTNYDCFSDTVWINGAWLLSVDFILTRVTDGNVVIKMEGSKDGVNFTNLDALDDSTTITAAGTTSFTFPYAPTFNYYRLAVHADSTMSASTKWKAGGRTNNAN